MRKNDKHNRIWVLKTLRSLSVKVFFVSIFTLLTLHFTLCTVFADFEDIGVGVRAVGLGNCYTAIGDDIDSIYYNPAGLSHIKKTEFSSSYSKLYWGLDDGSNIGQSFISAGTSLGKYGVVGFSWINLSLTRYYQENTFILGYSRKLKEDIFIGVNGKILSKQYGRDIYTEDDPLFNKYGYTKTGYSLDIGVKFNFNKFIIGIVGKDLLRPDVDLGNSNDGLPATYKAGIGYKTDDLLLGLDFGYYYNVIKCFSGIEKLFFNKRFATRVGVGIGTREFSNITLGLGYSYNIFRIDYAFIYPLSGIKNTYGTHRIGVKIGLPSLPKDEKEKIMKKKMKTYYWRGLTYYNQARYKKAIREFKKILKISPNHKQSLRIIKKCQVQLKKL